MEQHLIHIDWEGPFTITQVITECTKDKDKGIYQIYGGHTVYGLDVLLYIGKTENQTFSKRLFQHRWEQNKDFKKLSVCIGRLHGYEKVTEVQWLKEISLAEKLLIYSHAPACNSQSIGAIPEKELGAVHVLNWGQHRNLLPEVSGARWTVQPYLAFVDPYLDYAAQCVPAKEG